MKKTSFSPFIENHLYRSPTVFSISIQSGAAKIRGELEARGILVGGGYGPHKETTLRIANFPVHTEEEHMQCIDVLAELCM